MFSFRNQNQVFTTWIERRYNSQFLWYVGRVFENYLVVDLKVLVLSKRRFITILEFEKCVPKYFRYEGQYIPMRDILRGTDYWCLCWLLLRAKRHTLEEINEYLPKTQKKMGKVPQV